MYKELLDSASLSQEDKSDMIWRISLPLIYGDSITSAYARKPPCITESDLSYFSESPVKIPNLSSDSLSSGIDACLYQGTSHEHLVKATMTIAVWIATVQRLFSYLSSSKLTLKQIGVS